jgi:glyoxylase-like metal-dependent hydrolase (beta-lactamase superfamily II)
MNLGQSLHRVGNDIVAAYLVDTPDGVLLIDAGLSGQWRDLLAELSGMGRAVNDIKGVILTHGDTDHIGFAERLRREYDVPVYVHEADAARARGEAKSSPSWGGMKLGAVAKFMVYAMRKGGMRTTYLTEVVPVQDGQVLDLPGQPRIIGLPGHSAGSIAIHVPAADAVFVGDALTTRNVLTGASGPRPAPFTDDPHQALESLKRLDDLHATWVLPGHGTPWNRGVQEALHELRLAAQTR